MTADRPTDGGIASDRSGGRRRTRRGTLGLLGLGGLGLLAGQSAARRPEDRPRGRGGPFSSWRHDVDANGHSLSDLGSLGMAASTTPIVDFEGANLAVDDDGTLNAEISDAGPSVSDDGVQVVPAASDLDFGAGLTVSDDGDDTVTITAPGGPSGGTAVGPSVYLDFSEPFPEGEQQIIPYDATKFDPRGEFDTDTHQLTVAESGFYHVDANAAISRASGGGDPVGVCLRLLVNGTIVANACSRGGNDFFSTYGSISRVLELEAGDVFEVHGFVNNELGTASYRVAGGSAGNNTFLTVHRVG